MKKYFITGLAILLPFALTAWFVSFAVQLLTNPFLGLVKGILHYYDLLDHPFLIFSGQEVLIFSSRFLILIFLFSIAILVGVVARFFFLQFLFDVGHYIIERIPMISRLYNVFKEVVQMVFSKDKPAFSQAVLVPFPYENSYSLGFLTSKVTDEETLSIFVPATPNPSVGYMMRAKREEVIFLSMTGDEAFKFLMSCGTVGLKVESSTQ